MRFIYPVNLVFYSEDEVVAQFPDFPEAISSGVSIKTALECATDALDEAIAGRINRNEQIPEPSNGLQSYYAGASLQIALKAVLYLQVRKMGLNKVQFAQLLECDEKVARRLLEPRYNTPLKKIEEALHKLNIQPVIDMDNLNLEPGVIGKSIIISFQNIDSLEFSSPVFCEWNLLMTNSSEEGIPFYSAGNITDRPITAPINPISPKMVRH